MKMNVLPFATNAKYGECCGCQSGGSKKQKGGSIASLLQSLFPTVSVNQLITTTGLVAATKMTKKSKKKTTSKKKTSSKKKVSSKKKKTTSKKKKSKK